MTEPGLIIDRRGGLVVLTITREARRNALDAATSAAIDREIDAAEADPEVGVIILTGTGDRAFCSGMDMKEAAEIGVGHGLVPGRGFAGITERRRTKILIAAVNGTAVAGGFEIALACDLVIAADHALFGLSEVKRGLFAFAGGVQRLARSVPRATALGMILIGELLSARRMHELGLVTEVVPGSDVLARSLTLAETMLAYDRDALLNGKLLHDLAEAAPIDESLRFGRAFGEATLRSPASLAGVSAYVRGKR